ncbi:ABC transporter ATP-binding protein [[Clostridium] innocuum]|mgnify:FL=1|uniref:ABC transporter ATP-binding protein n=1 Tax=Clostridium innocuum TaxID=1522 RepID=A0A3E2VVU9_CLOIN|nr:ABC transporter ATP-binding protein [[Clostridium] innocuum]MBS6180435.1 ABC transporter ATP-binding protein [Erysipelotrichaceae bacterium]RHV65524.1 ABC transporter ATP-binding protein [Clostridiaceae bacterium OM02-2AC]MCR0385008.1 ABC transporter ATP-binding protein [[Clostridium] innocuum]MCR0413096.1 ABC transporter ATP-binding protein [[Clostridium] innocuum]MCR0534206.1 ABC transporter ATP-binding protein [[Clostridium] innocuum]
MLEMKDISYTYKGKGNRQILTDINMTFEEGKFYVIVGTSGSGKTTLLSLLAGLDEPQSGQILYAGEDIQRKGLSYHRRHHVSIVFQNYNLIDYLTPYENVCLTKRKADPALLHSLGLAEDEIRRNVMKLSGGQQQRTALGRSLASDAPIILADEPTGNLDSETADDIIRVLKMSASQLNKCVIVVTHSKRLAKAADVIVRLRHGMLYEI